MDVALDHLWRHIVAELAPLYLRHRSRLEDLAVQEKADQTLLTKADLEIERCIVSIIKDYDHRAVIVAEEDGRSGPRTEIADGPEEIWIIDPIDGTAEFVRTDGVEFCSVVCLLRDFRPVGALVFAPELGTGRQPITVLADAEDHQVRVDGHRYGPHAPSRRVSLTRSKGTEPPPAEVAFKQAGYDVKVRTTSQTLDMVRTAIDLDEIAGIDLAPFDLFHRRRQKVWDGAAGLCLGTALGLATGSGRGRPAVPISPEILIAPEPTFDQTVMGYAETVAEFWRVTR